MSVSLLRTRVKMAKFSDQLTIIKRSLVTLGTGICKQPNANNQDGLAKIIEIQTNANDTLTYCYIMRFS